MRPLPPDDRASRREFSSRRRSTLAAAGWLTVVSFLGPGSTPAQEPAAPPAPPDADTATQPFFADFRGVAGGPDRRKEGYLQAWAADWGLNSSHPPIAVIDLESELILEYPNARPFAAAEFLRAMGPGAKTRVYGLTGEATVAEVTGPPGEMQGCSNRWISVSPRPTGRDHFAVVAAWDPRPRSPRDGREDPQARALLQARVEKTLKWAKNLRIDPILLVDLEGDGSEEILASVSNHPLNEPTFVGSAYEGIWIYRPSEKADPWSEYESRVTSCSTWPCSSDQTWISGVLDVDGDGILEILLASRSADGETMRALDTDRGGQTLLVWRCSEPAPPPQPAAQADPARDLP